MGLIQAFLKQMGNDARVDFKRFSGKLSADKKDGQQTISLKLHIFDGAEYGINELQALEDAWSSFVPAAFVGFTAPPLLVVGTRLHSSATESGWIDQEG